MADKSDILAAVNTAPYGSILVLKDGREVPINLRKERLNDAFVERSLPPLGKVISDRATPVYAGQVLMTADEWLKISYLVRASPISNRMFTDFPSLKMAFSEPYSSIVRKHSRVYGNMTKGIHTFPSIDFHVDTGRGMNWYYGLLSYKGGWLIKTRVNFVTELVEIERENRVGYFIESNTSSLASSGMMMSSIPMPDAMTPENAKADGLSTKSERTNAAGHSAISINAHADPSLTDFSVTPISGMPAIKPPAVIVPPELDAPSPTGEKAGGIASWFKKLGKKS